MAQPQPPPLPQGTSTTVAGGAAIAGAAVGGISRGKWMYEEDEAYGKLLNPTTATVNTDSRIREEHMPIEMNKPSLMPGHSDNNQFANVNSNINNTTISYSASSPEMVALVKMIVEEEDADDVEPKVETMLQPTIIGNRIDNYHQELPKSTMLQVFSSKNQKPVRPPMSFNRQEQQHHSLALLRSRTTRSTAVNIAGADFGADTNQNNLPRPQRLPIMRLAKQMHCIKS